MIESGKIVMLVIFMVFLCGFVGVAVNPQQFVTVTNNPDITTTPVITATPTKPPVTPANIIPTIITPVPTITPTPAPTATTRAPRLREPTPTPVPTMNATNPYLKYEDTDFKVEYPSNWTAETSTVATTRNRLNEQMRLTGDARQVVFRGGNQSIAFVVTTADLLVPGSEVLKPDINLVSDMVTLQFDDVSGWNAVSNYGLKYTAMYKTPMVQFDVIIPSSSKSYPLTYTERDFISYSHFYSMRFTTPGNPEDYNEIRRHIFDTLQTEEIIKV